MENNTNIINIIRKESISELFAQVIDEIGLDNALKIARIAGGGNLYVPMAETIERPMRDMRIQNEFNGYNYRELALKYNKSESTIREIVRDVADKKRQHPISGQISI